jgi:hypothetical protein
MSGEARDSLSNLFQEWKTDAAAFVGFIEHWSRLTDPDRLERTDEWPKQSIELRRFRARTDALVVRLASGFRELGLSAQPVRDFVDVLDRYFERRFGHRDVFPFGEDSVPGVAKDKAESLLSVVVEVADAASLATMAKQTVFAKQADTSNAIKKHAEEVFRDRDRDRYFYDQRYAGTRDKLILAEARKEHPEWRCSFKIQNMRKLAVKYQKANKLPAIPPRKRKSAKD